MPLPQQDLVVLRPSSLHTKCVLLEAVRTHTRTMPTLATPWVPRLPDCCVHEYYG